MRMLRILAVALFILLVGSSLAWAQSAAQGRLSGEGENPVTASNAEGTIYLVVYPDRIYFTLTASGFGTDVVAAHIHL